MNSVEIALRRYRQIVPEPISRFEEMPKRALEVWLDEQLRACLEEYVGMPSFRDEASWPVRALRPDADTAERELIDRTAAGIRRCAQALKKLSRNKLVDRKLKEQYPVAPPAGAHTMTLREGSPSPRLSATMTEEDAALVSSRVIALTAGDFQLVNIHDYFWPEQVHDQLVDGSRVQRGDFIVFLNKELLVPGNFIVRCLLKRIRVHIATLRSFRQMALSAIGGKTMYAQAKSDLRDAWGDVTSLEKQVKTTFGGGEETRLRDACVGLTQTYTAIHPNPDVGWLGIGAKSMKNGADLLRRELEGLESPKVFERVAQLLGDLRRLPSASDPAHSTIEQAIAGGGLVLIGAKQQAFWETYEIPKLVKREWGFLNALAAKARLSASVEIKDVFGEGEVTNSAMSTTWSRLSKKLPVSLRNQVQPGEVSATYRLSVEPHRIHVF